MNSHVNTYIDMSTVKTRHNNARETAATLAEEYKTGTMVETIVCLKNTEVISKTSVRLQTEEANAADPAKSTLSSGEARQMRIPILVKMRKKAAGSKM